MVGMRGRLRLILKLGMASGAHLVRILTKLQGSSIRGFVVRVRIVASAATHRSLLEAFRTLEGLDDECGLAEAAVLIKAFARKFSEGNHRIADKKRAAGGIIQLAVRTGGANRGLHMTLRADCHKIAIADFFKLDGGIERPFLVLFARVHRSHVLGRWAVAHFAVDTGLAKLEIIGFEASTLHVAQLARVANGANSLVARRRIEFFP